MLRTKVAILMSVTACTFPLPGDVPGFGPAADEPAPDNPVAATHTLTITRDGDGDGTVTSSPLGIACAGICEHAFAEDTIVSLTVAPAPGSNFVGWSGACAGTTCTIPMTEARAATATFLRAPAPSGGAFAAAVNFGVGAFPDAVAIGDVNGDGINDLAVANANNQNISILIGAGNGTFSPLGTFGATPGGGPHAVALADLDFDTKLDLIACGLANGGGVVAVLFGNGNGTFQPATHVPTGLGPIALAVADVDGDADVDVITANQSAASVSVLRNQGSGTFAPALTFGTGQIPSAITIGDFNADADPDIAVANMTTTNDVTVLLGNGDATFRSATFFPAGPTPQGIANGDVNGDGKLDLVTANHDGANVSVLLGNNDGSFQAPVAFPAGQFAASVAIGDLNADGRLDLAVANIGSGVSVLLGNGNGTFANGVEHAAGVTPRMVAIGRLDADARPDLVVANVNSNNVSVLLALP